jgi:hypothetical protein
MQVLKYAVATLCFAFVTTIIVAQPPKPARAAAPKTKLPKLYTSLGNVKDTLVTMSADDAVAVLNQSLSVTDDKKGKYTIVSYQCLYKRKGVTENEENGKVMPATSVVAQRFNTTPLSEIWRKTLTEQLKSGEELMFFDIVVKDTLGKLMFAPNVKIMVK